MSKSLHGLWVLVFLFTTTAFAGNLFEGGQEVEFDLIEPTGPCAVVDGKYPTDPLCYEIAEVQLTPQVRVPLMALESARTPTLSQRSKAPGRTGGIPGMQEAKEIMNTIDWFWRFLEKNQAKLEVNTQGRANALPTAKECQNWENMGGWNPTPKAIPYVLSAKNPFGIEVVRLEYTIQFTYGGNCLGKGQYLENVRLVYGNASASLFFTAEVDVEIGDIVNFGTSEAPIAGLQILSHNRVKSLVKSINQSTAYYVMGNGDFSEVMPHRVMGDEPFSAREDGSKKDSALVGDGYELLDLSQP